MKWLVAAWLLVATTVEPAVNARFDSVWGNRPAYPGKIVAFNGERWVTTLIQPSVMLRDLAPAPIYRAHEKQRGVSLLINVAWGEEHVPLMLRTLAKHRVRATFFLEGKWAKKHVALARKIAAVHEIGNHSWRHRDFAKMTKAEMRADMALTNRVLRRVTHKPIRYFAPPSGSFTKETVNVAAQLNMMTILWSLDTIDWRAATKEQIIGRVVEKLHPGAFILMHPTVQTAASLDTLIKHIDSEQLAIVPVGELLMETKRLEQQNRGN